MVVVLLNGIALLSHCYLGGGVSKLGMYPQTVVPLTSDIHNHLINGMDGSNPDIKLLDGVYYTANRDGQTMWNPDDVNTWEKNPVYSYKGDRYVRVTPYAYATDATHKYNNTTANPENIGRMAIGSAGYRWFKVEPIKWIILNYDKITITQLNEKRNDELGFVTDFARENISGVALELYAADVLMGGISYDSNNSYTWNNQLTIYQYLNNEFYNQAFSVDERNLVQTSTIYNNNGNTDVTNPVYGLNSNHLANGLNATNQKIYLPSVYELFFSGSPYITNGLFEDTTSASDSRIAPGTDYARAHNLFIESGFTQYWLRTSIDYYETTIVYSVGSTGGPANAPTNLAQYGQRPALQLKLNRLV